MDDDDEYLVTIPTLNSTAAPAAPVAATPFKKRKFPMATECVGVVNIDLLKRLDDLEIRVGEADAMKKRIDDLETRLNSNSIIKRMDEIEPQISILELRVAAAKVRAEEVEAEAEQASNAVGRSNELASELASFFEKHKQRLSVETNRVLAERKEVVNDNFKAYVAFLEAQKNEAENGAKEYKEAIKAIEKSLESTRARISNVEINIEKKIEEATESAFAKVGDAKAKWRSKLSVEVNQALEKIRDDLKSARRMIHEEGDGFTEEIERTTREYKRSVKEILKSAEKMYLRSAQNDGSSSSSMRDEIAEFLSSNDEPKSTIFETARTARNAVCDALYISIQSFVRSGKSLKDLMAENEVLMNFNIKSVLNQYMAKHGVQELGLSYFKDMECVAGAVEDFMMSMSPEAKRGMMEAYFWRASIERKRIINVVNNKKRQRLEAASGGVGSG